MQPLEVSWGVLIITFALVGIVRGFLKELGVTTVLLVLLFGLSRLEDRIPEYLTKVVGTVGYTVPEVSEPAGQFIWASFYILVIVFVTLISYHGETLAFEGRSPKGPKGILFGMLAGLLNGYLISGTIWYYLHKYDYPIKSLGLFMADLSEFAQRIIELKLLPSDLLGPFLPFLVVFMILARVIR